MWCVLLLFQFSVANLTPAFPQTPYTHQTFIERDTVWVPQDWNQEVERPLVAGRRIDHKSCLSMFADGTWTQLKLKYMSNKWFPKMVPDIWGSCYHTEVFFFYEWTTDVWGICWLLFGNMAFEYLTGSQNVNQFFIESVSVLLQKTSALILHLLSKKFQKYISA